MKWESVVDWACGQFGEELGEPIGDECQVSLAFLARGGAPGATGYASASLSPLPPFVVPFDGFAQ